MRSILFGKGWINALVSRRDLICRLKILTLLKGKLGEQETMINGLLKLAQSKDFTVKQKRMVFAILQYYGEDLELYTRSLLNNWPPIHGSLNLSID